ncbi:MAG: hypothetical protein HOP30_02555 [Cyclobacteriaceae bacterium]|nr:hypothetical protein [Cyclobacteriaceae bacterium]
MKGSPSEDLSEEGGLRAVRYTPLPIAIGMRGAASIPAAVRATLPSVC